MYLCSNCTIAGRLEAELEEYQGYTFVSKDHVANLEQQIDYWNSRCRESCKEPA